MNIKNLKRKLTAGIMSGILLLSAVPFTGLTAGAAEDTLYVDQVELPTLKNSISLAGDPQGSAFIMSDGSIAICGAHAVTSPGVGAEYHIAQLGSDYQDGNLNRVDTAWVFKCFYYAEQLGLDFNIGYYNPDIIRSYVAELAARREYYSGTTMFPILGYYGWDRSDDFTAKMEYLYNEVVWAADHDYEKDNIGNNLVTNGYVYTYTNETTGYSARLAMYMPTNGATTQSLLVYSSEIQVKGYANLVKASANPTITDGNACYSLAGAVYGIYTDWDCTNQVDTFTTDEWGNSNTVELNAGTYYVKGATRFPISA